MVRRVVTADGEATRAIVYLDSPELTVKPSPTTAHTYLVRTAARAR